MSKEFKAILEKIPNTVSKKGSLIERLNDPFWLVDKFNWEFTIEGHAFWGYVNIRLQQLSKGIGYK